MYKFLKDFAAPLLSLVVVVCGMAWAAGAHDQRMTGIESSYTDLKGEVVKLREAVERLTINMATSNQYQKDHQERGR